MSNALFKNATYTYIPGSPGVAASPGSPATVPYTTYEVQNICKYQQIGGIPATGSVLGSSATVYGGNTYVYVCTSVTVPVYHPGGPAVAPTAGANAVPDQTLTDFNLGWNSGARSIKYISGDGSATFQAPGDVLGVVAGLGATLNASGVDVDPDFKTIDFGFYLTRRIARVYELGVAKISLGAYTDASVFKIQRRFGVVTYYIDGALVYTSATASAGDTFLDAALYSAGDSVVSPTLADQGFGTASVTLEPLSSSGGRPGYATTGPQSRLEPLTTSSRPVVTVSAGFLPLTSAGSNKVYGTASPSFLPLNTTAAQVVAPPYALSHASLVMLSGAAHGLTGGNGQGNMSFMPMSGLSGRAGYAESRASFGPLQAYGHAYEGNYNASMPCAAAVSDVIKYIGLIDVQLFSSITGTTTLATLTLADAAMSERVNVLSTMTYSAIMQALINSLVTVTAGIPQWTESGEVWVLNDETNAASTYENYAFNSFGKYRGKFFGANASGLYLLEGSSDAGVPVRASISLGKQDFGNSATKTVGNCYVGVSASGDVYLKVLAEGQAYVYKMDRTSAVLDTQRVKTGKGLRANYFTFELYNGNGADFEIEKIQFEVAYLSRRI